MRRLTMEPHAHPSRRDQRVRAKRGPMINSDAALQDEEREFAVTFDDVRKIALTWPEVEDGTSYDTPALKVRKKLLVRLREDRDSLVMPGVSIDEREMLVESQPKVFYFTDHYRDYPIALIRLSKAKRATVEPLLRRHWRTLASKVAVREFDAH